MTLTKKTCLASLGLLAWAAPALAHPGHGPQSGLVAGLVHPVLGLDHLLAMVAVGLWAGFALPRATWAGGAAFLAAMALGAGLAWSGFAMPLAEAGILASVVLFGLLAMTARPGQGGWITGASLGAVAWFALFHGHAHGTEAVGAAGAYLAGFIAATAALHGIGIALARAVAGSVGAQRALGAGVAASGLALIFA